MNNEFKNSSGFTAIDNDLFYVQSVVSASAFSLLIRIYRATHGYGEAIKALSGVYLQKTTNLSKNTVTKAIKELEKVGVLLIKRRSRLVSFYQISVKGVTKISNKIKQEMVLDLEPEDGEKFEQEIEEDFEEEEEEKVDNGFEIFWSVYDKKVNKSNCLSVWDKLNQDTRYKIMKHLELYIANTPDKIYRKDPINYLKDKTWEDEIIPRNIENKVETPPAPTRLIPPPTKEHRDVVVKGSEADKRIEEFLKQHGRRKVSNG